MRLVKPQLGYGVVPARVPRMATRNATNGEPTAFDRTMFFYRFAREDRAGWRETALIAHEWRQHELVKADQADQDMLQGVHERWAIRGSALI